MDEKQKSSVKLLATLGLLAVIAVGMVLWGLSGRPGEVAASNEINGSSGVQSYIETVEVDWLVLPGEGVVIVRHDDDTVWTVYPFEASGSVE